MASLRDKSPSQFYKDLLQTANSNTGISGTSTVIQSGDGDVSALGLGTSKVVVKPSANSTETFCVKNSSGTSLLSVDTTNGKVLAGTVPINTQVKTFSLGFANALPATLNTWTCLPNNAVSGMTAFTLGNAIYPSTSHTFTGNGHLLIPYYWHVPYPISIDAIKVITSSDTATGDDFYFSVNSFSVITSGSNGGNLSGGVQNAVNSNVTNAGYEQIYFNDLTVATPAVSAGKVILAMVRQDGTSSDLEVNMQIFYHYT